LKWKLTKGDTFYVTTNMESAATVNGLPGAAQGNTSTAVFVYKATVAASDEQAATMKGLQEILSEVDPKSKTATDRLAEKARNEADLARSRASLSARLDRYARYFRAFKPPLGRASGKNPRR
jgi:hypothetical protein